MNVQNSFTGTEQGTLYVVPTPIGNLDDMTFRAVKTLKKVDIIAAEDTRNTMRLLHYFDSETESISYHEHNEEVRGLALLKRLDNGATIAVVRDAGMSAISDPGEDLVRIAVEGAHPVPVLPGPTAV